VIAIHPMTPVSLEGGPAPLAAALAAAIDGRDVWS